MTNSRNYKCYGSCGLKYPKDQLIEHNSKKYCEKCLNALKKDQSDREELYSIIKNLYNVTFPSGLMLKQIKQFKEDYGYTYKGMSLTLRYCSTLPGIEFKSTMGIGIIPHQYENAKADFIRKKQQQEAMENMSLEIKPITVKISVLDNTNHLKKERLIDLEGLLDD